MSGFSSSTLGQSSSSSPIGSYSNGTPSVSGSPFGSFGNGTSFGSPFGTPSNGTPFGSLLGRPIFGENSKPAFGATSSHFSSTTAFRASSCPAFGSSTPAAVCGFGGTSNTPVSIFPSPAFGGTSTGFGVSAAPPFVSGDAPSLLCGCNCGSLRTNPFGSLSTSTSRAPNTFTFGMKSTSFSGNSGVHLNSAPAFGNSNLRGSNPPFGTQKFPSGSGHSVIDGAPKGSRVTHYAPTKEDGGRGDKLESICAMKSYLNKSHEELRLDYQSGDKGGSRLAGQSLDGNGLVTLQANPSSSSVAPLETSIFSSPVHLNPFAPHPSICPLGTSRSSTMGLNPSLNPFTPLSSPNISASRTSAITLTATGGPSVGTGGSPFVTQNGGSRITSYNATLEYDGINGKVCKIGSISAMPAYKNKSHEELRFEDFQLGDKGGFNYMNQSTGVIGVSSSRSFLSVGNHSSSSPFFLSSNAVAPSTVLSHTGTEISATNSQIPSLNFFSNQLAPQNPPFNSISFNASTAAHNSTSSNMISSVSPFQTSASTTGTVLQSPSTPQISSSPDLSSSPIFSPFSFVKSTPAPEVSSAFNNQPAQKFQFFAPVGHTSSLDRSSTTPSHVQQNMSSSSLVAPNLWGSLSSSTAGINGQSIEGQQPSTPRDEAMQQPPVTNPFGTPTAVQISVACPVSSISIYHGISNRPVSDNPAPVKRSSLLRVRQISLGRKWLPAQKHNARSDGLKVPFFANEVKTKGTLKADASFIPRENPRSWILSPSKEWILNDSEKFSKMPNTIIDLHENGNISLKLSATALYSSRNEDSERISSETIKEHGSNPCEKEDFNVKIQGNQDNKAADLRGCDAVVESVIPIIQRAGYYSEPSIQELVAKEKAEPGYCGHVKDFVVGRHGYGSIKFLGETDIRKLDLDAVVQFNYREIRVFMDESKRPPVGQGLNKPAEVTLVNVKCISKKTGKQYIDGSQVDQFREMLIKKATEQGAEFISFNPVLGEWRFKVQHF